MAAAGSLLPDEDALLSLNSYINDISNHNQETSNEDLKTLLTDLENGFVLLLADQAQNAESRTSLQTGTLTLV